MLRGARSLRVGELLSILGDVYKDHETGTLVFQNGPVAKYLYVEEGQIIFAASNAPEDKFTHILVEQGKLSEEQLKMAQEKKGDRTIGKTLVDLGFLASTDLLDALVKQVYRVAGSVLHWNEGSATFKPNVLPAGVAKLPISSPRFILDVAESVKDKTWVGQVFSGMETVLRMSQVERETALALPITQQERNLIQGIDGERSIREICEQAAEDLFSGAKFFLGLSFLGFVHPKELIAPLSQTPAKPLDISFLDEMLPSPEEQQPAAPPKGPEPQQPLPAEPSAAREEAASPKMAAAQMAAPRVAPPSAASQTVAPKPPVKAKVQPELFEEKPFAAPASKTTPQEAQPLFEGFIAPKQKSGGGKKYIYGAAALLVVAICAGAAWWFFMGRGEEVVMPPPKPRPPVTALPALPNGVTPAEPAGPGNSSNPTPAAENAKEPQLPKQPVATAPEPSAPRPAPAKEPAAAPKQETPKPAAPKQETPQPISATQPAVKPPNVPKGDARRLLEEGRYQEAASAFDAEARGESAPYTINIEVACQPETIAKGLQAAGGDSSFFILPYDLHGRSCFVVLWGRYASRAAAEAAFASLPEFFKKDSSPRIVSWASIKK